MMPTNRNRVIPHPEMFRKNRQYQIEYCNGQIFVSYFRGFVRSGNRLYLEFAQRRYAKGTTNLLLTVYEMRSAAELPKPKREQRGG